MLTTYLDRVFTQYHQLRYLDSDPLLFVHRYSDPWDQEAVGILSAALAYGNVQQIKKSIESALKNIHELADSPSDFVRGLRDKVALQRGFEKFRGLSHRFNTGRDIVSLLRLIHRSWNQYGSVGGHFLVGHTAHAENTGQALCVFLKSWKNWACEDNADPTLGFFLSSPQDGSCCKRWCMFLRWMGRSDELDLGLWTMASPLRETFPKGHALSSEVLVLPLDTHTWRLSQYLGLSKRKTLSWKAALEVTESLKACHPQDPTRYDFALARLGILNFCQKKYVKEICNQCELVPVCQIAGKALFAC